MKRLSVFFISILVSYVFMAMPVYAQDFNFPFNDTMTTDFGPAFADIIIHKENFLPCKGGPIALCYYSGPEPETCVVVPGGGFANCKCFVIPYGVYFVDIHAILNLDIYNDTVAQCGKDGSSCQMPNSAPVCETINNGTFIPGADMISTFSLECIPTEGIGCTDCTQQQPPILYAGCMTAPCNRTEEDGIVNCFCPTFAGPFQIGLNDQSCNLGSDNLGSDMVWSAAFNTQSTTDDDTCTSPILPPGVCIPDAPESNGGCPLLTKNEIPPPPSNIDCGKVCREYEDSQDVSGIEIGFTCDATLCTSACNDRDLVDIACSGLQVLGVTEIIKLEVEVGCSCCASQICGCDANFKTEQAVFDLNKRQRNRGITPQCDINDTLCGENSNNGGSSTCALAPSGAQKSFPSYILVLGLIALRRFRRK
ncbi:MAG: hypothetical protein E2O70_01865 [Candidatus Dadabacteria bacterium]|nr:MAG: hypothetical protein E2O70_01865 [Candidatus Dadabacteria bacterium]